MRDLIGRHAGWAILCFILALCQSAAQPAERWIRKHAVSPGQLPARFDTARTYVYSNAPAAAESLMNELSKAGIQLSRAWLPTDNLCMDPIGPRFTIELKKASGRIREFGFVKGDGRLRCARLIQEFIFP